jgi:lipooligosaccharide transport system ATP-binding protein
MHPNDTALILARGLTKTFDTFTAVDGIDFDVSAGEAFGFLGPNGAGKTSTMRMIACASPVTRGELRVLGMEPRLAASRIKARLGVVPQQDNLDTEITVRENLLMYARYFNIPRSTASARADELLDFVELRDKAGAQVESLSGGMKRRLTIARALVNEPDLILLDEPTTGLDPQARHVVWERLYQLKRRGATLLLTTHYMDEAERLCDRLVVMDKARIVAEGSPRKLIETHSTREVLELRFPDGERRGAAVDARRRVPSHHRSRVDRVIAALRIVQRNALVYKHVWRGSVFSSFLQPTLFLIAMGLGLGGMIDEQAPALPGGARYLAFLAPGLLAAAAMQVASFESTYPVLGKMTWHRNYEAISATPMRTVDLVFGELAWLSVRLATVAMAFLAVTVAFGIPRSPRALLAVPGAILTGLAFAAPIMAYAVTLKNSSNFNVLYRFGITPMFLFSGVFVPTANLPDWLRNLAWLTPLFHGVELVRGVMLDALPRTWPIHVGFLSALIAAGIAAALRTFDRRLRT